MTKQDKVQVDLFARKPFGHHEALVFFQPQGGYRTLLQEGGSFDSESLFDVANELVRRLGFGPGGERPTVEVRHPQGGRTEYDLVDFAQKVSS